MPPVIRNPKSPIRNLKSAIVLWLGLGGLAGSLGCVSTAGLVPKPSALADAKLEAPTPDGWLLHVRWYRPGRPDPSKLPVILCHGFGVNGTFWTLEERTDFAWYLSKKHHYEVFVPDLRGMGQSRRKDPFGKFIGAGVGEGQRDPYQWVLDDYALVDVPAIIGKVKEVTGAARVTWIGHSMGGMIMYAYLIRGDRPEDVQNFVAVGSPVFMYQPPDAMLQQMSHDAWLLEYVSVKDIAKLLSGIAGGRLTPFDTLYYNRDNVSADTVKRMYGHCMEDLPIGVARQLDSLTQTGEFYSADRRFNYSRHLDRVRVPMLFVAAKNDNMAPPGVVMNALKAVGSTDKTWLHLARANHFRHDYGHCDIIWGLDAPQEVFPRIARWLDDHRVPAATRP